MRCRCCIANTASLLDYTGSACKRDFRGLRDERSTRKIFGKEPRSRSPKAEPYGQAHVSTDIRLTRSLALIPSSKFRRLMYVQLDHVLLPPLWTDASLYYRRGHFHQFS